MFMGFKAFIIIYVLLSSTNSKDLFDMDIEQSHKDLEERFNQAAAPFGLSRK